MARIRSIKPDFWTDEKVVEVSAFARLLFIGLWNFADDEGRMVYSPKKIKMQIFPADSIDTSELFGEIRGKGLIEIYTVDNVEYLQVVGFAKHQKIDKRTASRLPQNSHTSPEFPRIPTTDREEIGKGKEEEKKEDKEKNTKKETPEAFEIFWEKYPRQRRGDKDQSLTAWRRAITKATDEEILNGLEAYLGSSEMRDGYAKGAAAWLNASRWTWDYSYSPHKPEAKPITAGDRDREARKGAITL